MLPLLVFQWFVLTFLLAYFKVMLKTRGDGVSGRCKTDIFNYLLFTLIEKDVSDETVDRQPVSLKHKRCKFLLSCKCSFGYFPGVKL